MKVFILGAGSIGNHLANAARHLNWQVEVFDIDSKALVNMRNSIYPSRYGDWDNQIGLNSSTEILQKGKCDLLIVGTPPDTHIQILESVAFAGLSNVIMVEKPICSPNKKEFTRFGEILKRTKQKFIVGYNHSVSKSFNFYIGELLKESNIEIKRIDSKTLESWDGILRAHPWLETPYNSYLGYFSRGGGALSEHSHGLHLFLTVLKYLKIESEVDYRPSFLFDNSEKKCDIYTQIKVVKNNLDFARLQFDLTTFPAIKSMKIETTIATYIWKIESQNLDIVEVFDKEYNLLLHKEFLKTRRDDFVTELEHIKEMIEDDKVYINSPLNIKMGLKTQEIITNIVNENFRTGKGMLNK